MDKKGIKEIDLNVEIPIQDNGDDTTENADIHILQGEVAAPKLPLEGMPTPPDSSGLNVPPVAETNVPAVAE